MTHVRINHPNVVIPSTTFVVIERALAQAFDRFTHVIREAQVTLRDLNGPKGGIDKQCTLQVRLYPRGLAVVKCRGASFQEAVSGVCDKIHQIVAKRLSKRRGAARKGSQIEIAGGVAYGN